MVCDGVLIYTPLTVYSRQNVVDTTLSPFRSSYLFLLEGGLILKLIRIRRGLFMPLLFLLTLTLFIPAASAGAATSAHAAPGVAGKVTLYPLPINESQPTGITAGPDGKIWFVESGYYGNSIGRITTRGKLTEFHIPTTDSISEGITSGPDGNLWFTESHGNKIGRITTRGTITEYAIPTANSIPQGITAGPDGNLWFVEEGGNNVGRITPAGTITEYAIPTGNCHPLNIAAGPDGNLWFTENFGGRIGRITTGGIITEFTLPNGNAPFDIAAGPTETSGSRNLM